MGVPKKNTGRPPSCECGECPKCKKREARRAAWQALSPEERRAAILRRDPEKVRAADRARYYRDWEKRRAAQQAYYVNDGGSAQRRAAAAWAERNPEKIRAQQLAGNAIRDGRLLKEPCEVCGNERVDAHHDDYSKPLDVRWLCRKHHMQHHRRYEDSRAA